MAAANRLRGRIKHALPWSIAESFSNALIGLSTTFVLTWFLTPRDMGSAAIALSIVGLVEIIAQLGMTEAFIAAPSGLTKISDTAFSGVMVSTTVAAIGCAICAPLGARLFSDPGLTPLIMIAALTLPLNGLVVVPTALLTRKMRARPLMIRFTSGRLMTLLSIFVLSALGWGSWAIVLGTVVGAAATVLVVFPTLTRWPRFRFDFAIFKSLFRFGGVMSFERLLWGSIVRLFWLIIGYVHGPVILGFFQFAQRLIDEAANLIQAFAIRFGLSIFSAMQRAQRDPTLGFMKASRLIATIATPIFAGFILVLPDMMGTVFSSRWSPAIVVSQVTAFGWIVGFPRVLTSPLLRAQGRLSSVVTYASGAFLLTLIAGALTGGQGLFVIGLAWVSRHLIGFPWSIYVLRRYLGVSVTAQLRSFSRPLITVTFMVLAVSGIGHLVADASPWVKLAAKIVAGAISYPVALLIFDRESVRLAKGFLRSR
jgi:O-antigen/teichoic acid export membrane protein